ncbi:hypothetical protein BU23DRAFT_197715 [Bimuria novae-zelandiae CBS 107.79]|uniref:Uncharacterized protein n=1 Tax=Bimuria novae-zelandiae CBS 107.79 TaxID=1447943 RepID=A0A6A5V0M9_9PLEO|nr:hypothetical protein BU23DRAFT_197715 [Bimuria novae-zelandiae CBS 107.79]
MIVRFPVEGVAGGEWSGCEEGFGCLIFAVGWLGLDGRVGVYEVVLRFVRLWCVIKNAGNSIYSVHPATVLFWGIGTVKHTMLSFCLCSAASV